MGTFGCYGKYRLGRQYFPIPEALSEISSSQQNCPNHCKEVNEYTRVTKRAIALAIEVPPPQGYSPGGEAHRRRIGEARDRDQPSLHVTQNRTAGAQK